MQQTPSVPSLPPLPGWQLGAAAGALPGVVVGAASSAALAPPLGSCSVDKRSACSHWGLFCLRGLLAGVGSADFKL